MKIPNELNGYKYVSSILIDDDLISDLLLFIKTSDSYKNILINYPINTEKELNEIIKKYQSSFNCIKSKLEIINNNHPRFGSCITFCILPK